MSRKPRKVVENGLNGDPPAGPADEDESDNTDINVTVQPLGKRQDPKIRREIRTKYSALRVDTQANREELITPGSDGLQQCLKSADSLFKKVKEPREAAMDAGYVAYVSNLGMQLAQNLHTDLCIFEPVEFAEKLITLIGGHQLADADKDRARISKEGWVQLGEAAQPFFKRSPPLHCMLGTFERGPPVIKQRLRREAIKETVDKVKGPTAPKELASFKDTQQQEVTTQEVERMLAALQHQYKVEQGKPICFFEFVVNPFSFGLTVENLFYASFLIRDGLARMFLDEDKLPVIEPVKNINNEEVDTSRLPKHQVVMTMTKQEWKDIVDTFHIKRPLIKPRESVLETQPSTSGPVTKKVKKR